MMRPAARIALVAAIVLALGGCGAGQRIADEGFARDGWESDAVLALLGIDPGDVVVDLAASADCRAVRVADAVGATGRVVALARDDSLSHLEGAVDLLFVCDAYHEISDRHAFFREALAALVPNGRVAILEETRGGTPADQIASEMREAGYEQIANHAILTRQSLQVFRPDDGTGE